MKLKKFKFKRVKSTNNTAIRIIKESSYNKGMVIAETQTNGRGQYGRKWISSKGNLFVSFFNELNKKNLSINTITKINCTLVKKLLSTFTRKKIIFKKPNDLLINKKKICGILQEVINEKGINYIIIGIGINVKKNPKITKYPATNLNDVLNKDVSKRKIESKLRKIFEIKLKQIY